MGDDKPHLGLSGIDPPLQGFVSGDMCPDIKIARASKPGNKISAHLCPVTVQHNRLHMVHIKREGVSKEDEEKQGHSDGHPEASPVPKDLDHLFFGDCFHPSKVHAAFWTSDLSLFRSSSLTRATKTSSREGVVLKTLFKGIPWDSRTRFTSSSTATSFSTMR